jgi:two-component system, OmpR family, copper resistance phosphate regulon response regulator CusR
MPSKAKQLLKTLAEKGVMPPEPRRIYEASRSVLTVADVRIDLVEHRVERAGRRIMLTAREFALLEYLMCHAGERLTRSMIFEHVWKLAFDTTTNVVDVYIYYLRRKVDDGHPKKLIHSVRGIGYELRNLA